MINKQLSSLLLVGGLVSLIPTTPAWAQSPGGSNSGLTIFSGVERENILDYHLDFGGDRGERDRYRLRIPKDKLKVQASAFRVNYPEYYDGEFDTDRMEVRVNDEPQPLKDVVWNKEQNFVELQLKEALEAEKPVELVFSNVENPNSIGTFYFNAQVEAIDAIPPKRYIGTWIVDIN